MKAETIEKYMTPISEVCQMQKPVAEVVCPRCGELGVEELVDGKPTNRVAEVGDNARCFDCKIEFIVKEEHILTPEERKERFPLIVRAEETGERICAVCGKDNPESYHFVASLSRRLFLCSDCWREQEDAEAERERQEDEYLRDNEAEARR